MRPLSFFLSLLLSLSQTSSRLPLSGVAGITSSGGGGISVVQHKSSNCSATSCSLAFASNNGTGNLLVYLCAGNAGVSMSAATDTNTNTISNALNNTISSTGAERIDYVASSHSGANTVTCSQTSSNRVHIHIYEISGTTGTLDSTTNTARGAGTSQSISTSSATTAANEIVFGFFYDQPNNDSLTAGTGFSPSEFQDGGSGNESSLSEVKIVSSTGTQTATATCGSNTNNILRAIATFK